MALCICGRDCDAANRVFHQMIDNGLLGQMGLTATRPAKERSWAHIKGKRSEFSYGYTSNKVEGKYWAIERKWTKTARGTVGRIVRKVGFRTRRKAIDRAYAWYKAKKLRAVS